MARDQMAAEIVRIVGTLPEEEVGLLLVSLLDRRIAELEARRPAGGPH